MRFSTRSSKLMLLLRRVAIRGIQISVVLSMLVLIHAGWNSHKYSIPLTHSVKGSLKEFGLKGIEICIDFYNPYVTKQGQLGPSPSNRSDYQRIESALPLGASVRLQNGSAIATKIVNQTIIRSKYHFDYQPYDEPRLRELREKYKLDEVVASAKSEFDAMVLLRNWGRSQFRRRDYQPLPENFDALTILDRNVRDHGETYDPRRHLDPCHFFPMFYSQLLVSLGYTPRLISLSPPHGLAEVWSNQHSKWVLMDAEYNHHFEKGGIPLNAVELLELNFNKEGPQVELVRGEQTSGDESTTGVHLGLKELTAEITIPWFKTRIHYAMRNDWMTNHYFPGHPRRSEKSGVMFTHANLGKVTPDYERRLRPDTSSKSDVYWTLNQVEIKGLSGSAGTLDLLFDTVTPNFESFEVTIDDSQGFKSQRADFSWRLHPGKNRLAVRTLNRYGIRGIESSVTLDYTEDGQ